MANDRNRGQPDPDETRLVSRDQSVANEETKILPSRLAGSAFAPPSREDENINFMPDVHIPGQADPANMAENPATSGSDTIFIPSTLLDESGDDAFNPVVGWVVIQKGPGRGKYSSLYYGINSIGRGADQRVRLDFGDARVSRESHAQIIYDEKQGKFFLRDGGQSNIVRLNQQMILTPTELNDRDVIEVGETELLFIALCNQQFDWHVSDEQS